MQISCRTVAGIGRSHTWVVKIGGVTSDLDGRVVPGVAGVLNHSLYDYAAEGAIGDDGTAIQRSILGPSPNDEFHSFSTSYKPPSFDWPFTPTRRRASFLGTAYVGIKSGQASSVYVDGGLPKRTGRMRTEGGDVLEVRGDYFGPEFSSESLPLGWRDASPVEEVARVRVLAASDANNPESGASIIVHDRAAWQGAIAAAPATAPSVSTRAVCITFCTGCVQGGNTRE